MSIGFVVIGRNEGERLTACLDALRGNGAPVVYADSASSDDSVARSRRAGATIVSLDSARPMNASRGRREGFDRLISDHPATQFVQFLDGDCILQPGWIEQATAFLQQNPQVAVACGLRFERDPQASIYNRLWRRCAYASRGLPPGGRIPLRPHGRRRARTMYPLAFLGLADLASRCADDRT